MWVPAEVEKLRNEILIGRVVVVAGAGVSVAAAGLPGWANAVERAIAHLERVRTAPTDRVLAMRNMMAAAATPQDLIACATAVRNELTGSSLSSGEFAVWLQETFGVTLDDVTDPTLLNAIHNLRSPLLATTNYDKILSVSKSGLQPITWQDATQLAHALRVGGRVVHLHGVWDEPASVIFGLDDYAQVTSSEQYQAFMRTIWLERTILFIGCSFDGLRDPDFLKLLEWIANTFPDSTMTHYALMRSDFCTVERVEEFLNRWRIQLVPYGNNHEDLAPFIGQLTPPPVTARPLLPPSAFDGRSYLLDQLSEVLSLGQSALVHGMGGIGKTSVVAKAVADRAIGDPKGRVVWLSAKGKTADDLRREVGLALGISDAQMASTEALRAQLPSVLNRSDTISIVLDDADLQREVQIIARELTASGTSTIVTSRSRSAGFDRSLEVGPLEPAAGAAIFANLSGAPRQDPRVETVCEILGWHPLAIELAAAKHSVEGLPLDRLIDRLSNEASRLPTLRDQTTDESRSSSVRASLQVSLDGLPDHLVTTLAVLAQFPAVPGLELLSTAIGISILECEDQVGQLVARSLVHWSAEGRPSLHQLVRDHVRYEYRARSERWESMAMLSIVSLAIDSERPSADRFEWIASELSNVIGFVIGPLPSHPQWMGEVALVVATILMEPEGVFSRYGLATRTMREVDAVAERLIELTDGISNMDLVVAAMTSYAAYSNRNRKHSAALNTLQDALQLAQESGIDEVRLSNIKVDIGNTLMSMSNFPAAEEAMRSAIADALASGEIGAIAPATGQLARVMLQTGRLDEARFLYGQAKEIYQNLGSHRGVAACSANLAKIAFLQEDMSESWNLNVESLEAEIAERNVEGALESLEHLARLVECDEQLSLVNLRTDHVVSFAPPPMREVYDGAAHSVRAMALINVGRYDDAQSLLEARLRNEEARNNPRGVAITLGNMSDLAVKRGDYRFAQELNSRSRQMYENAGDDSGVYVCHHNGVRFAIEAKDLGAARSEACSAIKLAALRGDVGRIAQNVYILASEILPALEEEIDIRYPNGEQPFHILMGMIAGAADECAIGHVLGAVETTLRLYGPGGISRSSGEAAPNH